MDDIRISIRHEPICTRITCSGMASLEAYRNIIEAVRAAMTGSGNSRKAFVDLTGMQGNLPEMEKFTIGEMIASRLMGLRIGVLMSRRLALTRFGENTAVNRGASLLVSYDPDELTAWLGIDSGEWVSQVPIPAPSLRS